ARKVVKTSLSVADSTVITASMPRRLMAPSVVSTSHLPWGVASATRWPFDARPHCRGHLRGDAAFIEKNQLLWRDPADDFKEFSTPLEVGRGVSLDGVERFFFAPDPSCAASVRHGYSIPGQPLA